MPSHLPIICPDNSCQESFSLTNADPCLKGGSITWRHDHMKNIIENYAKKAFDISSMSLQSFLGRMEEEERGITSRNWSAKAKTDVAIRDFNHNKNTLLLLLL